MVDAFAFSMGLLGGVAVFMLGLNQLTEGMKLMLGDRFRDMLQRLTSNRFMGILLGFLVTVACQSSGITTVLIVSLVSTGMLQLEQSVGVILGANVGSTMTGQLISFNIANVNGAFIAGGLLLNSLPQSWDQRGWLRTCRLSGDSLTGLGLVLLGMKVMSDTASELRNDASVRETLASVDNRVAAMLLGLVLTAIIQSSGALSAILISMASQGLITLDLGLAMMIGSNIGSCVPAVIASLRQSKAAQQAATVHVAFNILLVLIWTPALPLMLSIVRNLPPHVDASVEGEDVKRTTEIPRQIANAHTLINVSIAILLIPFTPHLASVIKRILPIKDEMDSNTSSLPSESGLPVASPTSARLDSSSSSTIATSSSFPSHSTSLPIMTTRYAKSAYLRSVSVDVDIQALLKDTSHICERIGQGLPIFCERLCRKFRTVASEPILLRQVLGAQAESFVRSVLEQRVFATIQAKTTSNDNVTLYTWVNSFDDCLSSMRTFQVSVLTATKGGATHTQTRALLTWGDRLVILSECAKVLRNWIDKLDKLNTTNTIASNSDRSIGNLPLSSYDVTKWNALNADVTVVAAQWLQQSSKLQGLSSDTSTTLEEFACEQKPIEFTPPLSALDRCVVICRSHLLELDRLVQRLTQV